MPSIWSPYVLMKVDHKIDKKLKLLMEFASDTEVNSYTNEQPLNKNESSAQTNWSIILKI
jgi:hypothetical protein